ncbi:hypothetical protein YC2023_031763 [Brassica napus]
MFIANPSNGNLTRPLYDQVSNACGVLDRFACNGGDANGGAKKKIAASIWLHGSNMYYDLMDQKLFFSDSIAICNPYKIGTKPSDRHTLQENYRIPTDKTVRTRSGNNDSDGIPTKTAVGIISSGKINPSENSRDFSTDF